MIIDAKNKDFTVLNREIKEAGNRVKIINCLGQRFIGSGLSGVDIDIDGIPGNALGAYFNKGKITVRGNAQDAVGDTMNDGEIIVHGNIGDAAGYAMRGGEIYIRGSAGYRTGIHIKAYADKLPVITVGESCGNFLGEYQAGGIIIVLGLDKKTPVVGNFCGTGMHGGKIFLRTKVLPDNLPPQVRASKAEKKDLSEIEKYVKKFCGYFGEDEEKIMNDNFFVLTPNSANPYKQLYVQN